MKLNTFQKAYLTTALWSSMDSEGEPLDASHDVDDIDPVSVKNLLTQADDFYTANKELIDKSGLDDGQVGHDFWLTQNGHGAGFWDRGLGKVGRELADAAKVYGGVDLYVGDDGKVYASGYESKTNPHKKKRKVKSNPAAKHWVRMRYKKGGIWYLKLAPGSRKPVFTLDADLAHRMNENAALKMTARLKHTFPTYGEFYSETVWPRK